jgi:hypothetical protein
MNTVLIHLSSLFYMFNIDIKHDTHFTINNITLDSTNKKSRHKRPAFKIII